MQMITDEFEIKYRIMAAAGKRWKYTSYLTGNECDPVRWQEQLCKLFGERDAMSTMDLLHAWVGPTGEAYSQYQLEHVADDLGKMLSWAQHEKVVASVKDGWSLLDRGPTFMNIGPAKKQSPIRIKDVRPERQAHVAKLVKRELQRRERAHWRYIEKKQVEASSMIDGIAQYDIMYPLLDRLEVFAVGDITTIVGARQAIIDFMETMDRLELVWLMSDLKTAYQRARMSRNHYTKADTTPQEDLDILANF
jgi:hypothetical protein